MRAALSALFVIVAAAGLRAGADPISSRAGAAPVESMIASAVRERMGADAQVIVSNVELFNPSAAAAVTAVPEPGGRTGSIVHFTLVGAGPSGAARTVGRAAATIRVNADHVKVRQPLVRGRAIAEADVERARGEVVGLPLRRLPTADEVVGGVALRPLVPGEIISHAAVKADRAVRSGQAVRATARVGSVEVSAELVAAQDGDPGSIIRVVNRNSRRALRARVLEPGIVEVIHE
jgi:flagella basal body P-ring formation protein FlgA